MSGSRSLVAPFRRAVTHLAAILQCPAGVRVLLGGLARFGRPYLIGGLARLNRRLLLLRVLLLRGWDQGGVHDLAGHGNVALLLQLPIEGLHHALQRPGLGQFVAKQTDRVLIPRRTAQIEAQEAHPRQPFPDHILGLLVRKDV